MIVAMPHCGLKSDSTSGGEVVERELMPYWPAVGVDAHVLRPSWRGLRWWNSPAWFAAPLWRCLRTHHPPVIRVHSLRYTGLAAILGGRLMGTRVTAHFHHLERDRLSWLDRWVLRSAAQVITDSVFSQKQARAIGVEAQVIRLGVDHGRFQPTPRPRGCVALLVGGTKQRKHTAFVRALWPEVQAAVPNARLIEIGAGHAVSDAQMPGLYRDARVVLMPSLLEGFGLPVLEAMASGRPVLCSDRAALPELDATTTLPLDSALWVYWLIEYLTNEPRWQAAAEWNINRAQAYSWGSTAAELALAWRACASA